MSATLKLYEIAEAREILDQWLLDSEGEVTPELEALLGEIDAKADEKIERVALYVREQKALAAAAKEEAVRVQGVVKRRETAAASLTLYLQRQMEALGKEKVNGLLCTVAIQKNPPSVKGELSTEALRLMYESYVFDESNVTPKLVQFIPEQLVLDRRAVLVAHKAGQPIPDGLTVEQGTSVRIR